MKDYIEGVQLFTYAAYAVTFGDVLNAKAGSISEDLYDSKLNGNYELDYVRLMI